MKIATSTPPLKVEVLSSPPPPLFENLVGGSTLLAETGGGAGAHYDGALTQPTLFITKRFILDVAAVLDPPLLI